jgi:tRNA(Ile)-lysidine synthetase-like protein
MNKAAIPLEVRRHKLVASVRNQLHDKVLVGISGGADSTALLLLCCAVSLQQSSTLKVVAGHINHGIRSESDAEQQMVETLCKKIGVICISKRITVTPIDGSLGAGARKGRYDALLSIATQNKITQIAVAHHATDQLETMLMALCRGGGPRKLAGMAAKRKLSDDTSLVRPLLHADQNELRHICNVSGVTWCNDPTNSDPNTPRGKLRLEVLPKLRELWPAADQHAANASVMLQAAANALDAKAMFYGVDKSWNRKTLSAVSQEIVAALMHKAVGNKTPFKTVQSIAAAITDSSTEPREFDCGSGCVVRVTANKVCVDQP